MSTTLTLETSTSRAHPVPEPVRRLTVPAIRARKRQGRTEPPIVMLTAYTARMAQLLDPHCDLLLVGDSLGQVIYGLDTTVKVTLEMMIAHGAAVVRGSWRAVVVVDLPFGTYEASPEQAFATAARVLRETGAAAVKLEGGERLAATVRFLVERGVPVMGHVGLTPQAINLLGGYGARGRDEAEARRILADARAVAEAGCFALVVEGVVEPLARAVTQAVDCPVIGIGASPACDGQVLVIDDMLGMFERTPRFVRRFDDLAARISAAAGAYADAVRARQFPGEAEVYRP
ncbi:MAG: 3-methyl-2-oxobutanoate hydroxymethyltransferase [Sphingomonadaceae bacterium]|uniref:3-methyl-2-oxobutanoate hydroxymethyltransferase n=1 Tax=Thermaurantiacus sp. TaxID=2820283 RepID=UPI00298F1E4E|nr:3-methyl-2-oxobutanoate hydroxymethyltransferase [Thermaurantiacus sp.]MCS6986456.1 3-methyl-2-oxobutanoate hydroxymethyltransferase [Sphingomonadaceae bacterium]MDW8414283.1 3-methyl-2-oxobutanoate hydroxymethyltransferase [Thermaurantiacus sp.]